MDRLEWYTEVSKSIQENMHEFYEKFYGVVELKNVGAGYRINPCPNCGHNDCCSIKENIITCFSGSCDWRGTHINAWLNYATSKKGLSYTQAVKKLEEFTGIRFPAGSKEDQEAYERHQRKQAIMQKAEEFYSKQLLTNKTIYECKQGKFRAFDYMTKVRQRQTKTMTHFKIGFSSNYLELHSELISEGYTKEEIKECRIWIPEGLFVFFYRHPITKDIVRMNTKNPFNIRFASKDEFGKTIDGEIIKGFSSGLKSLYMPGEFSFDKDVIIVEGEHDLFSLWEQGFENVCAIGGQIERDSQLSILKRMNDNVIIYLMFDNDPAGNEYTDFVNDYFADRDVRAIKYPDYINDPDDYFKEDSKPLSELLDSAEKLVTEKHVFNHFRNKWMVATRDKKLEFTLKGKNDKGNLVGSISYYSNRVLNDRDEDTVLMKCKAKMKPLNFFLHDEMEKYFNSDLENKSADELVEIYKYSSSKTKIVKLLAEIIFREKNEEELVNHLKIRFNDTLGSTEVVDNVLKELNDIQNKNTTVSFADIPKMKICQYFNVKNNDAYTYFTYVKVDGDVKRKLPFLLRNDGTLIRLDLLKRKDSQCLLLVDNKYELPFEVTDAILDLRECSLTQDWVEKFIEGNIPEEELDPGVLIREIERYIRKFYYTIDPNIYKVLALYIYMTYYYELFGQVPYLFLNGEKGSGKSILDTVIYMLAFDAKMAVDISESSLFRMVSIEGGTIILDEMENLASRKSTQDSTMAAALKGGYSRSGLIYRYNKEKNAVEGFNVYSPKVISNIFGIDDVIEDRCIQINSYRLKVTKDTKMEDPKYYLSEKLDEVRELTSKCAISALQNFQKLFKLYNSSLFVTGNARLSQILTPIQAVAKLVDLKEVEELKRQNPDSEDIMGEFETALTRFYGETLAGSKNVTNYDTPEGIIKSATNAIARELYGLVPTRDIEYTNTANHKYTEAIRFSIEEGWFEVNALHFKCFVEESMPGDTAFPRIVPKWVKTCFNISPGDIKRRIANIDNEDLLREFKGNAKPKVNYYKFYFKDFVDVEESFFKTDKDTVDTEVKNNDKLF